MKKETVQLNIDYSAVDTTTDKQYQKGRVHVHSRAMMPEKQLFSYAEYHAQAAERTGYSEYSYWKSVWRDFLKNKPAVIMSIIFCLLFLFTFVAGYIGKYDVADLRIVTELMFTQPNGEFWFGTDNMGRDYWAQVWYATRSSVLLAVSVSLGQIAVGVIIGLIWGYVRKLDRLFTEIYNLINNIPTIIYLTLIALMLGKSMITMGIALIGFGWLATARNVRNLVFMYRDREYNLASRCLGTSTAKIIMKNLLPYLVSVIMLRLALSIPAAIGNEVFITYIGLGLPVDTPSLGNLINEGRKLITSASLRYQLIFPAIVLSVVTISFYIIGNAFADAADPKNHV